ncbi:MAG: SLC13 family permease, partial [Parasphingopyxis sp.]
MSAKTYGFFGGLIAFAAILALPAPEGMTPEAWRVTALTVLMASWWMTQALPLTATALLPFVALPFMGVMTTGEVAGAYYSPILFLILGGAFVALAIERTGLHRRLALAIISRS